MTKLTTLSMAFAVLGLTLTAGCGSDLRVVASRSGAFALELPGECTAAFSEEDLDLRHGRMASVGLMPFTGSLDAAVWWENYVLLGVIRCTKPAAAKEFVTRLAEPCGTRAIGGASFDIARGCFQGLAMTLASTTQDGEAYVFCFMAPEKEAAAWGETFRTTLDSVSFRPERVAEVRERLEDEQRGFLTGLWHGLLLLPRAVLDLFGDVDLYADNHSGSYLVGFLIGLAYFVTLMKQNA